MSGFWLKLLALLSMFTDHSAHALFLKGIIGWDFYILLRGIGRIAFPVYCFLLVQGFEKSRHRREYLQRLIYFALISQLPFCLLFGSAPDLQAGAIEFSCARPLFIPLAGGLAYGYCTGEGSWKKIIPVALFLLLPAFEFRAGSLLFSGFELSVFYTLAFGLCLIWFIDSCRLKTQPLGKLIVWGLGLGLCILLVQPGADYGLLALALIVGLYLAYGRPFVSALVICLWSVIQYGDPRASVFTGFAALSLLPVLLYNGQRGPGLKMAFYWAYPVHLSLLCLWVLCL